MREATDRADGTRTPSLRCAANKSGTVGCYHMKFCHWPFLNTLMQSTPTPNKQPVPATSYLPPWPLILALDNLMPSRLLIRLFKRYSRELLLLLMNVKFLQHNSTQDFILTTDWLYIKYMCVAY